MGYEGSWSGMRKYLEKEILADSLKGRVRYGCTTYVGMDGCKIFEVCIDDKQVKRFSWETVNNYFIEKGYKSIAIIGKDINECKFIKKKLEKLNSEVKLIQSKDSEYNAGISIVPSYLAKGLEFDSVMLFNVNDKKYQNTVLDIKLLYVAITRAMSKLDVFYTENISELMK